MGSWVGELCFVRQPGKYRQGRPLWRTKNAFSYVTDSWTITVPEDYEFDGASVPRPFWIYALPSDALEAAAAHDVMCDAPDIYDRRIADARFLCMLKTSGIPAIRRYVMFLAVRIGALFGRRRK